MSHAIHFEYLLYLLVKLRNSRTELLLRIWIRAAGARPPSLHPKDPDLDPIIGFQTPDTPSMLMREGRNGHTDPTEGELVPP